MVGSFGRMPLVALSCYYLILSLFKVNAQSTFSENLEITLTATAGIAEITGIQITIPEQRETVTQMQMITVTQTQLQTVIVTANDNCAAAALLSSGASEIGSSVPTTGIASAAPFSQSSAKVSTVASATAIPAQATPILAADSTLGCPCACMCPSAAFGMMLGNASVAAAIPAIEPITTLKTVISTNGANQEGSLTEVVTQAITSTIDEQPLISTEMSLASTSSVISASTMATPSISASPISGSAFSSQIITASLLSSASSPASSTSQDANKQASSTGSSMSFDIRTFSLFSAITVPLNLPAATPTAG